MKKLFVLLALLSSFAVASVESGKKTYQKDCKNCHGLGSQGAFMSTQKGWDELFAKGAQKLQGKHVKVASAADYFGSVDFFAKSKDLHEFLKEFASDSGNLASCSCEGEE